MKKTSLGVYVIMGNTVKKIGMHVRMYMCLGLHARLCVCVCVLNSI